MKLHTPRPEHRRLHAKEAVWPEQAETEFDLTHYLLGLPKLEIGGFVEKEIKLIGEGHQELIRIVRLLPNVRILEQFLDTRILSPAQWKSVLDAVEERGYDWVDAFHVRENFEHYTEGVLDGETFILLHRLFPDDPYFTVNDTEFAKLDELLTKFSPRLRASRQAVKLISMRPERRAEIVANMGTINKPDVYWHGGAEELAASLLIHPEWRNIVREKKFDWPDDARRLLPESQGSILFSRAVAFAILASPRAYIDEQGVVRVEPVPKKASFRPQLPERPL